VELTRHCFLLFFYPGVISLTIFRGKTLSIRLSWK